MVAVYARQSIEKKDSISIESQIEECRRRFPTGVEAEIFADRGFSGKDTNRPEFRRMMELVKHGEIAQIAVYKVDRISRSLSDFLKMKEVFDKYGTKFISCKEDFDTSTAAGKMMLNLLIMFAEMERDTIRRRITDNYYARGEKAFYLGGYPPFGYGRKKVELFGKRTYSLEENPNESAVVRKIFADFASGKSLGAIARSLNENGEETRKNGAWSGVSVSRLLGNPVYVRADCEVYTYIKGKGAVINNPPEEFVGRNGCIVYGNADERKRSKFRSYETDFVTLAPHEGIIEPTLWLSAQKLLDGRMGHTNSGGGKSSWLQGIVKCGCCGYREYVKSYSSKTSEYAYFYCRGKKQGVCKGTKMLRTSVVECAAEKAVLRRLNDMGGLSFSEENVDKTAENRLKVQLSETEQKIQRLVESLAEGGAVSAKYIGEAIERLDKAKAEIAEELQKHYAQRKEKSFSAKETLKMWRDMTTAVRKAAAAALIAEITEFDGVIEIHLN